MWIDAGAMIGSSMVLIKVHSSVDSTATMEDRSTFKIRHVSFFKM
jgi:hypothetical protein